jgi:hypothetical protein
MRLCGAWGSALNVVRFAPGGWNVTAVQPPCPQGLNIDRPGGLVVIGGWCAVHDASFPVDCRRYSPLYRLSILPSMKER